MTRFPRGRIAMARGTSGSRERETDTQRRLDHENAKNEHERREKGVAGVGSGPLGKVAQGVRRGGRGWVALGLREGKGRLPVTQVVMRGRVTSAHRWALPARVCAPAA